MKLVREIPAVQVHAHDAPEIGSIAGTLRGVLAKLVAWLALEPDERGRVGVDMEPGAVLLLVPAEVVSPERFDPFLRPPVETFGSVLKDEARAVFAAAPVWISLAVARVPSSEFLEASAVWRLGGVEALRVRWPSVLGG